MKAYSRGRKTESVKLRAAASNSCSACGFCPTGPLQVEFPKWNTQIEAECSPDGIESVAEPHKDAGILGLQRTRIQSGVRDEAWSLRVFV